MFRCAIAMSAALAFTCCQHVDDLFTVDGGADTDTQGPPPVFPAVDMLLVVDNSSSMSEEQSMLSTAVFQLFSAFLDPGGGELEIDDLRLAVTSSDLGMSWGGNPYQQGDGWPNDNIPCTAAGDDGELKKYPDGLQVDLGSGAISCQAGYNQCPPGWSCQLSEGIDGVCVAPGGDGSSQDCPPLDDPLVESEDVSTGAEVAMQVACLVQLGTSGCGFEQQLQAATRALNREDHEGFVRSDALLAVLAVTDEGDCSMRDGPGLFAEDEIQEMESNEINLACGNHPEHLYSPSHYRQRLAELKGGDPRAVVFAAIAGVPIDDVCQGSGDQLDDCLSHEKMKLVPEMESSPSGSFWVFRPACERVEGSELVTRARPGRRLVELAMEFGTGGYVASICNEDWQSAMADLATLIEERVED